MFPLDRWWRQKHGVAFNSEKHRNVSQIDIFFEFWEDKLYRKASKQSLIDKENQKLYEQGVWLKEQQISKEEEDSLFEKLKDNFTLDG